MLEHGRQCLPCYTNFSMTLQTEILSTTKTLDFLKQITTLKSLKSFNSVLYNICFKYCFRILKLLFFALFSLIFGNIYSHFELAQSNTITAEERTRLFIGLSGAALLGTLSLFALRKKRSNDSEDLVNLNTRFVWSRSIIQSTGEYLIYFMECVENIRNFTSA